MDSSEHVMREQDFGVDGGGYRIGKTQRWRNRSNGNGA